MVIKTDFRRRIGTFPKRENPIQESLDFIGCSHVWIGTKIETSVLLDLTGDNQARIALIGDFDKGIRLIVLEHDIVLGLVLLDEVDLKKQGLNIGLGDDKLKIHNLRHQGFCLGIMAPTEVGSHPIAQIFSLSYINDSAVFIFVNVTTRASRQELQF